MLILVVLALIVCGIVGALVAQSKNVPPVSGATVGLLLGPVGVLIVACLPRRDG